MCECMEGSKKHKLHQNQCMLKDRADFVNQNVVQLTVSARKRHPHSGYNRVGPSHCAGSLQQIVHVLCTPVDPAKCDLGLGSLNSKDFENFC